jgi:hypothetical protein
VIYLNLIIVKILIHLKIVLHKEEEKKIMKKKEGAIRGNYSLNRANDHRENA